MQKDDVFSYDSLEYKIIYGSIGARIEALL